MSSHISRIIDQREHTIIESNSIIGFETTGGGSWPIWDRFLTIEGEKAYHIGNICGTCSFFFKRLEGASRSISPAEVRDELNRGVSDLSQDLIDKVSLIMPPGKYIVSLSEISPVLVEPEGPNDYFANELIEFENMASPGNLPDCPNVRYYRSATMTLAQNKQYFEFIIPMVTQECLNQSTIDEQICSIQEGKRPTALAISMLEIKGQENFISDPNVFNHRCLAHYLIDGHHKMYAASKLGLPITLLSFLALEQSNALQEEIHECMESLKSMQ